MIQPNPNDRLARAREILTAEASALGRAAEGLDERFSEIVDAILGLRGKVVLTGVGKSGLIAQKIAATLSSTGTPALFLHSVEAVMGDLGILSKDDLLIAISNSGETNEVVNVVLAAGTIGTPAVALTGNPESTLARECQYLLPLHVSKEAGPHALAPTTSTTVTLGLGDALAMVLMEEKKFSSEQFAVFHPGGALGRRLSLKVRDVMRSGDAVPTVHEDAPLSEVVNEISHKEMGMTFVAAHDDRLLGIITDGDIRRLLQSATLSERVSSPPTAGEVMTRGPRTIEGDVFASEALRVLEVNSITTLAILDSRGRADGVVHLHDILGRAKFTL